MGGKLSLIANLATVSLSFSPELLRKRLSREGPLRNQVCFFGFRIQGYKDDDLRFCEVKVDDVGAAALTDARAPESHAGLAKAARAPNEGSLLRGIWRNHHRTMCSQLCEGRKCEE
jgi:hypothetical protein